MLEDGIASFYRPGRPRRTVARLTSHINRVVAALNHGFCNTI